ncbi:MAG: glycosyltransferase [Minisyncoccia bacterium]
MNTKRKKILYVITKSNFGGAQRYVYELATNLPQDTFDVTVAFGGNGLLKQKLEEAGIKTRTVHSFERDINFAKELKSFFELRSIINEIKPDIVHLNSSKAGGSGALVSRLLCVKKIIFTAHGWAFWEDRSFLWRSIVWLFSWITALLAHTIIVVSNYEYTRTPLPFMRRKLTCIHTAVPEIIFKERESARTTLFSNEKCEQHKNDLWVVSTSEHNHNKNILSAIRAVEEHNAKESQKIFFTIMSDGEYRTSLEAYVNAQGLQNTITFTGYVDDARSYLKAFDIFILPSRKEGMPYGLLEAGAAGLSCIASHVGGIPEIITHEKNGLLIDPNDISSMVNALQFFSNSPSQRESYARTLAEKIKNDFSLTHMLKETIAVYSNKA